MGYTQPELGFEYDALEPHFDALTMETHYAKHHAGYCKKYNAAAEGTEIENKELKEVLSNLESIPQNIKKSVINNGGGAWNHSFFWNILAPKQEAGEPSEELTKAINDSFESMEEFKKQFKKAATTVFGSGWAWLIKKDDGTLEIITTANQDSPISKGLKPILTLDVWEHAYYLKYKNLRPDFIEAFFNIINWKQVSKNYTD